ncbi:nucleotidyltransferase domain-containing protein [Pleionea litopenaei]|uniref:Cyclic GMP-AMP synthase n=1 Tax=Pleionea litopenaei TaxID=3070815 RepID=A0AA51RUF4_9GAMM|nr:nucleotidyltransferase [Pleionea sp. HL-JVS1]WMS87906.1 nucleotidyltransferase [Pleionea sp. HL-JVS1]
MTSKITKQAEDYLEALVNSIEISPSKYEQAEKSYKSLGEWLHREDSSVRDFEPDVYVQGSFRLGTAVKPQSKDEEYDVDSVCSLTKLDKSDLTQNDLKALLGKEIKLYRDSKGITKEVHEGRRCWRLDYSDGAQFHMDIVPSIPNGLDQRRLLEAKQLDAQFSDSAIAITDNEVIPQYFEITDDWPRSNPRGYAEWFKSRMGDEYKRRRIQVLNEMRKGGIDASIEDIPTYRVRTPLQSAIMVLKHHRDTMFVDDPTDKPISIIISTLAAHAYQGEDTIGQALLSILERMEAAIEFDGTKHVIKNPTDALENFADKWESHPERARAFYDWLDKARTDFYEAGRLAEQRLISSTLETRMGSALTSQVLKNLEHSSRSGGTSLLGAATSASTTSSPEVSFDDTARTPKRPKGFA